MTTLSQAAAIYARYEAAQAQANELKRQASQAASEYGQANGLWGFSIDHLKRAIVAQEIAA